MDLSVGSTRKIIDACKARGLPVAPAAYVLATPYWETGRTMKPIYEKGSRSYFNKYEPGTKIGADLGNTQKGDGYLYRGRGFVQLTGRANYAKAGKKLGLDLLGNPDLALDPAIAARILVEGMVGGWFTGKRLMDYFTSGGKSDFVGARRIINRQDKAKEIAGFARQYVALLQADGYGNKQPKTEPAPAPEPEPALAAPPVIPIPPSKDTVQGVQARLKELGYNPGTADPVKGWDGVVGPLTGDAIVSFKIDNGLAPDKTVDAALITALATAKPREMVPSRANATVSEVAAKVPEANVHWWTRLGAYVGLGGGAVTGATDYIAPSVSYLQPIKDFVGDVPAWVWIVAVIALCLALGIAAQYGLNKSKQAFNSGDRR